jgi:hypothetical protein
VIGVGGGAEKQLIAMTPLRSHRIASDIAPVAVFLTSEVSWLTGKIILASSGLLWAEILLRDWAKLHANELLEIRR